MTFPEKNNQFSRADGDRKNIYFFYGLFSLGALSVLVTTLMSYYLSALFNAPNDSEFFFKKNYVGILTIVQFSAMALGMLLAWQACIRFSYNKMPNIKLYLLIALIAVVCRIALLGSDHYTSNDVDRYLFDGKVATLGLDPYVVNHQDPELEKEAALWKPPAEHMKYTTLYPPLALALFSASAATGIEHAKFTWKLLVLSASLLVLLFSFLTLKKLHLLHHFPLVAFSPLLILEAGVGLHLDIFSTLAVSVAIYAWVRQRWWMTSIVLGLGALIKIIPILCLLPLVLIQPSVKRVVKLVFPAVITVILGYAIAITLGLKPVGSLGVFFEKWRSGSPLFLWLDTHFTAWQTLFICLGLAAISFLLIAGLVYKKRHDSGMKMVADQTIMLAGAMQAALAVPLLISPVIFPWYVMPLIPLLAIAFNLPVLLWTIMLPILYEVLGQFVCCQQWSPAVWPTYVFAVGYLTVIAFLIYKLSRYFFSLSVYSSSHTRV